MPAAWAARRRACPACPARSPMAARLPRQRPSRVAIPTGTVEFVVNGTVYESAAVSSGTASVTLSLPYSTTAYSIYAVYSGDSANDSSTSAIYSVTVTPALTTTTLSANTTSTTLGHPVALTATVTSSVGTPTGTVTFTYTTSGSGTPQATTAILSAGTAPDTSV